MQADCLDLRLNNLNCASLPMFNWHIRKQEWHYSTCMIVITFITTIYSIRIDPTCLPSLSNCKKTQTISIETMKFRRQAKDYDPFVLIPIVNFLWQKIALKSTKLHQCFDFIMLLEQQIIVFYRL